MREYARTLQLGTRCLDHIKILHQRIRNTSGSRRQGTNLGLGVRPQQVTHRAWGGKSDTVREQHSMLRSILTPNPRRQTVPESGGCLFLSIFLRSSKVTPSSLKSPPCITLEREMTSITTSPGTGRALHSHTSHLQHPASQTYQQYLLALPLTSLKK